MNRFGNKPLPQRRSSTNPNAYTVPSCVPTCTWLLLAHRFAGGMGAVIALFCGERVADSDHYTASPFGLSIALQP